MKRIALFCSVFVVVALAIGVSRSEASGAVTIRHVAQAQQPRIQSLDWDWGGRQLNVRSQTLRDGGRVPQSMVYNAGVPGCSGQNKSPQLSWYGAPWQTQSFVVQMYDPDGATTHWGMYNIPAYIRSLPENAGVPGSSFGPQIGNDFYNSANNTYDQHYDGPCPPTGQPAHRYVITVFALDEPLNLISVFFGAYPPLAESLFYGLVTSRRHILASGHILGYYSR